MTQGEFDTPKKKKISWLQSFFWGVFMVCWSFFNIHRGVYSVAGWIWDGVLMAIGVMNLLIAALAILGKDWIDPSASAKRLATQQKALFSPRHIYRSAKPDDYQGLDGKFYAQKTEELKSLQFRKMREVVNVSASNTWPRNRAVIRGFLDPSGTVYASIYHLRIFGFVRLLQLIGVISRKMKTVECETELSDGTFVATSNTLATNKLTAPPFMHKTQFPSDTSTETIVNAHRSALASILASRPGVQPTVCRDNKDVQALQDRMQALKSAFRRSPGFDHRAEWEKIAGRQLTDVQEETVNRFIVEMDQNPE